ncbi:MAG: hypothetical protein OXC26_10210, partial [Albidovulum sp.]|nr:hypothetical protein [Albidovulum sp.]
MVFDLENLLSSHALDVIGATFRELYLAWKVFSGCQMSGCCVAARCLMRSASLGTSGAPATP